jgi:hypothetical protein
MNLAYLKLLAPTLAIGTLLPGAAMASPQWNP